MTIDGEAYWAGRAVARPPTFYAQLASIVACHASLFCLQIVFFLPFRVEHLQAMNVGLNIAIRHSSYKCSAVAEMDDRLAIDMARKEGN